MTTRHTLRAPVLALLAVGALLAACGSDQDPALDVPRAAATSSTSATTADDATPTTVDDAGERRPPARAIAVTVAGGEVEGGPDTEEVALGETVRIEVRADTTDEVHVHGYDRRADVTPGQPAVIELVADIPGVFEVELERAHLLLFELQVSP